MLSRFSAPLTGLIVALLTVGLLTGCAALQSADDDANDEELMAEEEPDAPAGPAFAFLHETSDGTIALRDAQTDSSETLLSNARFTGVRLASPDGEHLAFTYTAGDSTYLARMDLDARAMETVDARAADVTYSLAWHPEDAKLAYGYYGPVPEGERGDRGPGGIRVARADGSTRSVQCQSAREVIHWISDGSIATRDDENLYVVNSGDCTTEASVDARRMHQATYSRDGTRLAYIHRELSYNQEAGEYQPDSSLHVSDAHGQSEQKLFGDDRSVRHLQWSPDRSELAFDALDTDTGTRQVLIYNGDRDQTSFLVPPTDAASADQIQPRWSPSGDFVGFTLRDGSDLTAAVRIEGQTRRLGSVDAPVWGWINDRALVTRTSDTVRVQSVDNETLHEYPAPAALIHAWERPVL